MATGGCFSRTDDYDRAGVRVSAPRSALKMSLSHGCLCLSDSCNLC